jgi:hypothetical protein
MRADLLAATVMLATVAPNPADACSISPEPAGHIFGSTSELPGRRPWISLWNVKDSEAVAISVVATAPVAVTPLGARCEPSLICTGTSVAFDRHGTWLRPRAELPAGARVQVILGGKRLLAETLISKAPATALPVWNGIELVRIAPKTKSMCAAAGPEIELRIKPTKAALDHTVGLFYLTKPDPKAPHKDLLTIEMFGSGADISLTNEWNRTWLEAGGPAELWVILADDHGNVGAPIKLI